MKIKKTNSFKKIKQTTKSQKERISLSTSVKKQSYKDKQHLKEKPQSIDDMFKALQVIVSNLKNKITLKTIKQYEDKERIDRAKRQLKVYFLNSLRKNVFNFVVKSSGLSNVNKSYTVKIQFKNLLELKQQDINYKECITNSDLGLECSCDDYRYRFRYWVTKLNALPDGAIKELRYTKLTNPNSEHKFLCKHIILVTNSLNKPSFRDNIFKRYFDKIDTDNQVRVSKRDRSKTISLSKRTKF